jgi:2-polyprenyl-3-methyl-5-hydroxy-6-metoxy-1,4-benzoquinol methylase
MRQVDFVVDELGLAPGSSVLDMACGRGRHSVELARRGFRVTGVDLSCRSLGLAHAAAENAGVVIELRRLDMREIDYDGVFDAVINLFTAFGYLQEEAENERVVQRIAAALRRGGAFLREDPGNVDLHRHGRVTICARAFAAHVRAARADHIAWADWARGRARVGEFRSNGARGRDADDPARAQGVNPDDR